MNLRRLSFLTAVAATLAATAASPQRLDIGQGVHHPVLSPDGTTLLYSSVDHTGLKAVNLTDGTVSTIDQGASAGFAPVFSADGKTVYYRTASMVDGLLCRDVRAFTLGEETPKILAAPTRDKADLNGLGARTYAFADYKTINVTIEGKSRDISPVADAHSYLWASLSPDARQISFMEPFKGVFICNADGSEPRNLLPKGDFVSWAGPHTIIAVVSHDDGYVILDSKLVAIDTISGETTQLTDDDTLVGEATASASGRVIYTDLDGNMFIIDLYDR